MMFNIVIPTYIKHPCFWLQYPPLIPPFLLEFIFHPVTHILSLVTAICRKLPVFFYHVSRLFRYHDDWCVRIPANYGRHNRSIDNAKTSKTIDPQPWVYHCLGVSRVSHLAGANGVVDSHRIVPTLSEIKLHLESVLKWHNKDKS